MKKKKTSRKLFFGIDTSLSCTGWSVIEKTKKDYKVIDLGKIIPKTDFTFEEKCNYICIELDKALNKYQEEIVGIAIEQPNSFRNGKTVRALSGLYGVVRYFIFVRYAKYAVEINTIHAKKIYTGDGKAQKDKIVEFTNKRFGTEFIFKKTQDKMKTDEDLCDAISMAVTLAEDLNAKLVQ